MSGNTPLFTFTNYRPIPAADYKDDAVWSGPWLTRETVADRDIAQLQDILDEWGIGGDPFAIRCGDFEGFAEVGFKRWDVLDDKGSAVFTIWTYSDSGMIYRYGTTERAGEIIQCGAEFEDSELGSALEASRLAEKKRSPDAPLPPSLEPDD